jgi:hypothetical protein
MQIDKTALVVGLILFSISSAFAQDKTIVKDPKEEDLLLGARQISLQWISWDYFGTVVIEKKDGLIHLTGKQEQKNGEDYLTIEGVVVEVRERAFVFKGSVVTRVSSSAGGKPCTREDRLTFRRTGKRRYWRMQQMENPCDGATDYVDVFLPEAIQPAKR